MMIELITTVVRRPYVFLFLTAYLFLAWRLWGWRRTLLWLVSGYLIALASEYASIHWNIPYGEYHYIYENLTGEFLVAGVPFFDSLSYPFLIFAGYTMACFMMDRLHCHPEAIAEGSPSESVLRRFFANAQNDTIVVSLLGALLTMLLDVIIDPVATMGDKWFLGQIHYYVHPGWYFGVPFTNFTGWFLVPLAVISFNNFAWHIWCHPERSEGSRSTVFPRDSSPTAQNDKLSWLTPIFYFSIALFNIAISFWIGEWKLGATSAGILTVITTCWFRVCFQNGIGHRT